MKNITQRIDNLNSMIVEKDNLINKLKNLKNEDEKRKIEHKIFKLKLSIEFAEQKIKWRK